MSLELTNRTPKSPTMRAVSMQTDPQHPFWINLSVPTGDMHFYVDLNKTYADSSDDFRFATARIIGASPEERVLNYQKFLADPDLTSPLLVDVRHWDEGTPIYEVSDLLAQSDRANTMDSNNNLPENLDKNKIQDGQNQHNFDRAGQVKPEQTGESPDQNPVDKIESGIQEIFRPGHEGVQLLKQQLEDDTDDSNWIANAAIATGLDVLDFAMGMVEGIPLGILDTRNIGEGIAEGTWEGAERDISRALSVLPQGKILKAVDRALTAGDVVETLNKGDLKGSGIAVGMAALAVASKVKKGNKGNKKRRLSSVALDRDQMEIVEYLRDGVISKIGIYVGMGIAELGAPSPKRVVWLSGAVLHARAKKDLQKRFGDRLSIEEDPRLRLSSKHSADLLVEMPDGRRMMVELKGSAKLTDDGRLITKSNRPEQIQALEESAQGRSDMPHIVVAPNDIFIFDPGRGRWDYL